MSMDDTDELPAGSSISPVVRSLAAPLVALRELGRSSSLTAAAESLGIPQPTLSRQVKRLQEQMGVRLSRQQGRNLVLTAEGRVLAAAATDALDVLESGLSRIDDKVPRVVRLGTLRSLSSIFVPGFATRLADHDRRSVQVREGADPELLEALRHDDLDLVLTSPAPDPELFGWQPLLDQEMVLSVPAEHHLAGQPVIDLREVADEAFLLMSAQYSTRTVVDELLAERGLAPRVVLEADDVRTLRHYVALGMGVAVLPYEGLPDERLRELRIIRTDGTMAHREAGVAWRRRPVLPESLQTAVHLLAGG